VKYPEQDAILINADLLALCLNLGINTLDTSICELTLTVIVSSNLFLSRSIKSPPAVVPTLLITIPTSISAVLL
jgi:hypothetical protein